MDYTEVDTELRDKVSNICNRDTYVKAIFLYCESQEDRKRLLDFIKADHDDRKEVLLMASQIGIESGTVEGELIDE